MIERVISLCMLVLSSAQLGAQSCAHLIANANLSFNGTITLGEIATILVNLAIAIILKQYLAARSDVRKSEKRILARQVEDAIDAIRACQLKFLSIVGKKPTKEQSQLLLLAVEHISDCLASLEIAIEFSHCKEMPNTGEHLTLSFLQYKRVLTGGDFPNRSFSGVDQSDSEQLKRGLVKELQAILFNIGKY